MSKITRGEGVSSWETWETGAGGRRRERAEGALLFPWLQKECVRNAGAPLMAQPGPRATHGQMWACTVSDVQHTAAVSRVTTGEGVPEPALPRGPSATRKAGAAGRFLLLVFQTSGLGSLLLTSSRKSALTGRGTKKGGAFHPPGPSPCPGHSLARSALGKLK